MKGRNTGRIINTGALNVFKLTLTLSPNDSKIVEESSTIRLFSSNRKL